MRLKFLRQRHGLTQAELAGALNTTQQTIARWESGKTPLTVPQLKDLCIVLQCSITELLGETSSPTNEERRKSAFSSSEAGVPYGTLRLFVAKGLRDYPINAEAREALLLQLGERSILSDDANGGSWLSTWTMDNKVLSINPAHLRSLLLMGDDVEAMPSYAHPEVYRALEAWDEAHPPSGKLKEACEQFIQSFENEDAAIQSATHLRITHDDGTESRARLTELVAAELLQLELPTFQIGSGCFLQLEEEGFYLARFFNLDQIALIEAPADLYHRLLEPESEEAPEALKRPAPRGKQFKTRSVDLQGLEHGPSANASV